MFELPKRENSDTLAKCLVPTAPYTPAHAVHGSRRILRRMGFSGATTITGGSPAAPANHFKPEALSLRCSEGATLGEWRRAKAEAGLGVIR